MVGVTLSKLAAQLRAGERPLLDYIDALAAHFAEREPQILAFVPENGRFQRLRRQAQTLLATYPDPAKRPSLFGLPIGVKDIFHVDGFVTRAGSQVPAAAMQGAEADSVTRLRQAGVLILGKTVTTEFAYFAPGPTRNPHNPAHTPGGSSSGSAAAVAAGLVPFAFGTQTIGSVNRPAAFCGTVGYKPSFDRIDKAGVIPLAASLDHVGFFVPDVADVALVARLLCHEWQAVDASQKPVLGIPEGPYLQRAQPDGLSHFRATCARLVEAGFMVKSVPAMANFDEIYARHNLINAAEAALTHRDWFARYGTHYHAKTAALIREGEPVDADRLAQACNGRLQLRQTLTTLMEDAGIDLWLSPPAPGAAPAGLDSTGDPVMNLPWTHSGLPTLTLPAGFNDAGLPLGLQLTAGWYQDEAMLVWAGQIASGLA